MATTTKWTQRDGTKIRLKDMSDSHIQNTISMLHRKHDNSLNNLYSMSMWIQGEMASDDLESVICDMESDECSCGACDWIVIFKKELKRRGKMPRNSKAN